MNIASGRQYCWTTTLWHAVSKRTGKEYSFFIFHFSFALSFSFLLSITSCFAQSQSARTQYLLYSQSVRGSRVLPADELESLIPQKPNKRILRLPFTPALWWYQWGARHYDRAEEERKLKNLTLVFEQESRLAADDSVTLKQLTRRYGRHIKRQQRRVEEGNSRMRIGEAPSYFLERDALANTAKLQLYLRNKGFFQARASYSVDTLLEGRVRVNYTVTEGVPYVLRSIAYEIADPAVDSLVRLSLPNSPLHVDNRYDADQIRAEAVRIEEVLRNKGYYEFSRQYVRAQPDTSINSRRDTVRRFVELYVQVLNPPGQTRHPVYRIGAVEVSVARTDVLDASGQVLVPDTVQVNGVAYYLQGHSFATRLLDTKIRLRPGQLYRQRDVTETQRQLFLLNQFKFVNINFVDTARRELRTRIVATPTDKYEYSAEGGLFVLVSQQGAPPGPFGNLTFRIRNFFGGLETFETSLRYGLEAQVGFANDVSQNRPLLASELNLSTSLIFPEILLPGRMRYRFDNLNPRTQISIGYGNTRRPDFTRSNLRTALTYSWQPGPGRQVAVSFLDLNYLQANIISQQFQRQLDSLTSLGSTIRLAYRNAFASDVSASFTYNTNPGGTSQRSNFLRITVESGGTTLNFLSKASVEQLRQNLGRLTGNDSLQLYKYLRINIDYRYYIPLRPHVSLAFRLNTGLVWGYGSNRTAPYEKLFFVGGSNSIRAWPSRRLGPGSAFPYQSDPTVPYFNDKKQFVYLFEQPGNLLVEGSAELRARWFRFGAADVNVAAFIDVGNVWTIDDTGRKGGNFQASRFLTDMAVGTGVGLRFGFSFFILRLDGGIKVWDPARRYLGTDGLTVDDRFILPKFSLAHLFSSPNPLVVQFGIGYPF